MPSEPIPRLRPSFCPRPGARTHRRALTGVAFALGVLTGCGSSADTAPGSGGDAQTTATAGSTAAALFPDVLAVSAEHAAGAWRFDVTMSSPYDSPERYADAWRVVGDDGVVYGVRELTHDHGAEQPFTRSLHDVEIPESVASVTVEGRDQQSGWGGVTVEFELDRS